MPIIGTTGGVRSFSWPWKSGNGPFPVAANDDEAIRLNLMRLYSVEPGDDKTDPTFGLPLLKYVFATTGEILEVLIRTEVSQTTTRWEPRAVLNDIVVTENDDETNGIRVVDVLVEWSYRGKAGQPIPLSRTSTGGTP